MLKGFASPALLPQDLELEEIQDDLVSITKMCFFFSGGLLLGELLSDGNPHGSRPRFLMLIPLFGFAWGLLDNPRLEQAQLNQASSGVTD